MSGLFHLLHGLRVVDVVETARQGDEARPVMVVLLVVVMLTMDFCQSYQLSCPFPS